MTEQTNPQAQAKPAVEMVNLTVDGKPVSVPKGTNLIDAAKAAGVAVPYYCYHPHLSVAGNCRMCQIRVKGAPKMEIACNTMAREGMEVSTQESSPEVADAQAATLEFILINHPLDCTVCDQAGHCKLQDYHYEYNARPSRFLEHKEHKVKAEPLGPTVMLDGERCIMCTRCVRFCDEVTKTSELGMLNRGDRSVIAVAPGKELSNPLSGTVVDLCPVGALTHRSWRFNTRIWFTKETDSICPGCSTGCNVKVAERDNQVVQVKGRLNADVNKEWLCDEGRYGFMRFLPKERLAQPVRGGRAVPWDEAYAQLRQIGDAPTLVLAGPELLTEEYWLLKNLIGKYFPQTTVAIDLRERALTETEAILISPDYAANFKGAELVGLVSGDLRTGYSGAVEKLRRNEFKNVFIFGDRALSDHDATTLGALRNAAASVATLCDGSSPLIEAVKLALPARSVLEKSGILVNRKGRAQYSDKVVEFPTGTEPEWRIFANWSQQKGHALTKAANDRELTNEFLASRDELKGRSIAEVKKGGVVVANG